MPAFDLYGIRAAKFVNTSGVISYTDHCSVGDAMSCNLQLKYAEGRLYAEGALAEYLKLATSGSVSIAVKYLPTDAQKLLYGAEAKSTTITKPESKSIEGVLYTTEQVGSYVGVTWYAPSKIDGVTKYVGVFVHKASFSAPSMNYKTKGENIEFQTPTTTGEFLPDTPQGGGLYEIAVCDTKEEVIAWCKTVLKDPAATKAAAASVPAEDGAPTAEVQASPEPPKPAAVKKGGKA